MQACDCPGEVPLGPALAETCGGSTFLLFMGVLETLIRAQCELEDPCGRASPRFRSEPDYQYDFIVVGGGSAGSVVAARLSEVPNWNVLVIEAGGDEPAISQVPSMFMNFIGSDIDWKFKTEPQKNACLNYPGQKCSWPRGKVLGGTSVFHGMMYNRGNKEDYDDWEAMGNSGWKYDDVLPYFKKSEDNLEIDKVGTEFHASGGPLPVSTFPHNPPMSYDILKGAQELGYKLQDLNGKNATGAMIAQVMSKNGIRYSSARAFLRPARNRPNLHIWLNTTVTRILVNPTTKITRGVEVIDQHGNKRQIFVKKEVIVSGGAVSSPHILLLSGIGPTEDLMQVGMKTIQHLDGVGKNLQNHVSYSTMFVIDEADKTLLNWPTAMEYLHNKKGLMSGTGLSDVKVKISTKYAKRPGIADIQVFFGGYLANCAKTGHIEELNSEGKRIVKMSPAVLNPHSKGYITLASADPLHPPKIVANYLTNEHDLNVLMEGIKFAIKLSQTTPLKAYGMRLEKTPVSGCENLEFGSDPYWECAIKRNTAPENHQAGSCKMGPIWDPYSVVSNELKVHGIHGLRVIDASIMPEVISGNTHAPIVMIAEKGSDMIKKTWEKEM